MCSAVLKGFPERSGLQLMHNLSAYLRHALSSDPGLASFDAAVVRPYVWLAFNGCFTAHTHVASTSPVFPISRNWVMKWFPRYADFARINAALGYFEKIATHSDAKGYAAAWTLSDRARDLLEAFWNLPLETIYATGYESIDGRRFVPPRFAVSSRTIDGGNSTWKGKHMTKLQTSVTVDSNSLGLFIQAAKAFYWKQRVPVGGEWVSNFYSALAKRDGNIEAGARLQRALDHAVRLYATGMSSKAVGCTVFMQYQEAQSGRLYTKGVSLQNCVREVKRAALPGRFDVDMVNAHYSILAQIAHSLGAELPDIDMYNSNKKAVRAAIAAETGLSVDTVKTGLVSLIYGAVPSPHEDTAFKRLMGAKDARKFLQHPFVKGISKDLRSCRKQIIAHYREKSTRPGSIVNDMGKAIVENAKGMNPRRLLAHILQGCEARCLDAMLEILAPNTIVLQHDGVVTDKACDVDAVSAHIFSKTGWKVKLEQEQLRVEWPVPA